MPDVLAVHLVSEQETSASNDGTAQARRIHNLQYVAYKQGAYLVLHGGLGAECTLGWLEQE